MAGLWHVVGNEGVFCALYSDRASIFFHTPKVGEADNKFLQEEYIMEYNSKFTIPAAEGGTAFAGCRKEHLDRVFSIQTERIVNRDNTVKFKNMCLQFDRQKFKASLTNSRVVVHEHRDDSITICFSEHEVGRFEASAETLNRKCGNAATVENVKKQPLSQPLGKVASAVVNSDPKRLFHIPTVSTAG